MKTNEDVRAVKSTAHLVPPQSRRMPRLLQRKGTACYHVVSRINARAFLLTDAEKEVFRDFAAPGRGVFLWGHCPHLCSAR